jgi:hypothetical protein
MIATVVSSTYPLALYCLVVVSIGLTAALMTSRPIGSSLGAALLVLASWCASSRWLPFSFRVHAEECIIEPLLGKESPLVLAFHLLVPMAIIVCGWCCLRDRVRPRG